MCGELVKIFNKKAMRTGVTTRWGLSLGISVVSAAFARIDSSSTAPARSRAVSSMEPAVDLSLHPPAPPTQTLLVTNRLLQQTAQQLNTFASTCEEKLITMHHKMLRLETGVKLLEAKLGSLPGATLDAPANGNASAAAAPPPPPPPGPTADGGAAAPPPPPPPPPLAAATSQPAPSEPAPPAPPEEPEEPVVKIKDDPRFSKFFKMEKMGVPKNAVKMKFAQETGLDPSLMDTPDAPAPPGGAVQEDSDEDSD